MIAVPPTAVSALDAFLQRLLDLVLQAAVKCRTMSEPGTGDDRLVAAGDRSELAVMFLRLLAIHTFEDVVVFLLEPSCALQVRVRLTNQAATYITVGKDPLVFAERGDAGHAQRHDRLRQLRIDLTSDIHKRVLLRREGLCQRLLFDADSFSIAVRVRTVPAG